MENKVVHKYGFIINYKFGRKYKIHKEIQSVVNRYGLLRGNRLTLVCFNNLQEAISVRNLLMDITETSESVYAIEIKDGKAIEFQEIFREIRPELHQEEVSE